MEHNYLEILKRIFGEWDNCIQDPGKRVVIIWGLLPDRTLAIL